MIVIIYYRKRGLMQKIAHEMGGCATVPSTAQALSMNVHQPAGQLHRRFDWDDLRIFLAVARSGAISLAGRQLQVNHSTVGRRIAALEASLNAKLFCKNAQGYLLTETGRQLVDVASRMERLAFQVEDEIAGPAQTPSGFVKVNSPESFTNFFLSSRIGAFMEENPQLSVEIISVQQLSVPRHEADITITMAPSTDSRYACERLVDYRLYVYASPKYLAENGPITSREDLERHPFVSHVDDFLANRSTSYLDGISRGLKARFQSSSVHAKIDAVASGFGLCVLPGYVAGGHRELTPILTDDAYLERSYWLVVRSDSLGITRIKSACAFIRAAVSKESTRFGLP